MTATVHPQNTATLPRPAGPLTVPLEIIRAAEARHRLAVDEHDALPGWALIIATTIVLALIAFAILEWRDLGSPLLIACALVGIAAAYTPDVLAARARRSADA